MNLPTAIKIYPGATMRGVIQVPGDKSITHRALIIGALCWADLQIVGWLKSLDCLATCNAVAMLGVKIQQADPMRLCLSGVGLHGLTPPRVSLDLGNSGTALRLLTGVLAAQPFASEVTGDASLCRRPMARLIAPLTAMGAQIVAQDDQYPPLKIYGGRRLKALQYALPIASAQVQSALQLAALYTDSAASCIITTPAVCRDHTAKLLRELTPYLTAEVAGNQAKPLITLKIPGDFSSAAFLLAAALLIANADLTIERVGLNPTRIGLLTILQNMGAQIIYQPNTYYGQEQVGNIYVKSSLLTGIDVPTELIAQCIDELPILAVIAAHARGVTRIRGAAELRVKETDRIAAIAVGLTALGVQVITYPDGLDIVGLTGFRSLPKGIVINSFGDHRIAMAFIVAGMVASQPIIVENVANIATSFPGFIALANKLGAKLTEPG